MNVGRSVPLGLVLALTLTLVGGLVEPAASQEKPEGEMRFALYVTISPSGSTRAR